jgi:hypothetical protein
MIRILGELGVEGIAKEIAADLHSAHELMQPPQLLPAGAVWDGTSEWDDVLIVIYKSDVPQTAKDYIRAFRDAHAVTDPQTNTRRPSGFVMPIALDPTAAKPPEPISGIKALVYDDSARGKKGRLADWVGVFLGLALRPRDQRIFISYRIVDGSEIAKDLYKRLEDAGCQPWLDEANDNLQPGSDVQDVITKNLKQASMVLVVDTPEAPRSRWIKVEIDAANSEMIPVLPVVVGERDRSRFVSLAYAQRQVLVKPGGIDRQPLSDGEWDGVLNKISGFLRLAYQRRQRTTFNTQQIFLKKGFDWVQQDPTKLIFRSWRQKQGMKPEVAVLSHCCIHDATDISALRAYRDYLEAYHDIARINWRLCVYDQDETLSEVEQEAIQDVFPDAPFILAHHSELPVLLPQLGIL